MESLRQEIRDEMKSLRVNKKHVYDILLRLVDELDSAKSAPAPAPVVELKTPTSTPTPAPAPAPVAEAPAPVEEAPKPAPVKKVVRRTRKKAAEEPKLSA